jgi:hypothetical protein
MNKKRKILTIVALLAFSVIIMLRCSGWPAYHHSYWGDFVSEDGRSGITRTIPSQAPAGSPAWMRAPIVQTLVPGYWNWERPPLRANRDFHMSLFVLAVFYAGLFFTFGGKDAEPVPRRPRNWRRIKIIGVIVSGLVVIAGLSAAIIYAHKREATRQANIELEKRQEATPQAKIEEEKRQEATPQAKIEEEDSKHRITSSEIDLIDLRLERPWPRLEQAHHLTGRIRNRTAHNRTLNSITLIVTLREQGSPDILGVQTVQIRVEVPPHQTRAISQMVNFPNSPELTQYALTYSVTEIRGSKGSVWDEVVWPDASPTP